MNVICDTEVGWQLRRMRSRADDLLRRAGQIAEFIFGDAGNAAAFANRPIECRCFGSKRRHDRLGSERA
jgi:hypothetical protein